jgi:hypothetical protein
MTRATHHGPQISPSRPDDRPKEGSLVSGEQRFDVVPSEAFAALA